MQADMISPSTTIARLRSPWGSRFRSSSLFAVSSRASGSSNQWGAACSEAGHGPQIESVCDFPGFTRGPRCLFEPSQAFTRFIPSSPSAPAVSASMSCSFAMRSAASQSATPWFMLIGDHAGPGPRDQHGSERRAVGFSLEHPQVPRRSACWREECRRGRRESPRRHVRGRECTCAARRSSPSSS